MLGFFFCLISFIRIIKDIKQKNPALDMIQFAYLNNHIRCSVHHMGTREIVKTGESRSVVSNSLQLHGLEPTRFFCLWNSPGKNTGVGCHSLLQGIFLTQGSNSCLLHCRWILYCLSHQRSPQTGESWWLLTQALVLKMHRSGQTE